MLTYTDGKDWYECTDFEEILFTVTADEKVAIVDVLPAIEATAEKLTAVDVHPTIKLTIMETEYYYDETAKIWEHFFDVYLDDSPATVEVSVSGMQIKEVVRFS